MSRDLFLYPNRLAISVLALGFVLASRASAEAPIGAAFTYQGQLKESGTPAEGSFLMTFRLFDVPTGGTALGEQTVDPVDVTAGLFTVELNAGGELGAAAFNGGARWLEIQVETTTLVPRQPLTAAPYALFSTAPWVTSGSDISYTAGNVGIGVSSPGYTLDFSGDLRGNGRIAFGNEAEFGSGTGAFAGYERLYDFSERITDFSAATFWTPVLSATTADPTMDLTGDDSKMILHALIGGQTPAENAYDIANLEGAEIFARHTGSGQLDTLVGAVADCWLNGNGSIINATGLAAGGFASSFATGTIDNCIGIEAFSGTYSPDSSVATNTGIIIRTPGNYGPIGDNYGLYIEDQDVAQGTSYAIYSAGGDIYLNGRIAAGSDAEIGIGTNGYDRVFDFSHTITDFSSTPYWTPFTSLITIDSPEDLTGPNAIYYYAHDLESVIPGTNTSDYQYVTGPYMASFQEGSGTINVMGGAFSGCQATNGHLNTAFGFEAEASHHGTATVDMNLSLSVDSGHYGTGGGITTNHAIHVWTPYHDRPIENNYGLYLEDQNIGTAANFAIYAAAGDTYLNGDLEVTGTMTKGGGSFKIDHPLDPENKYLYHSFVESPDMMNIYNGNIVTDEQGRAVVTLPDWFEALNRDFRYQLTVIGQFAQAIVEQEIQNQRFSIRTDKPQVKVSWQVTGVRKDAFADANRIPIEVEKPAAERGRYLHPELYGQPRERQVGYSAPITRPHLPRPNGNASSRQNKEHQP